jgi:hypothetical protein
MTTWHRNAGARTYHADRPDWVRSGRALCGADIGRAFTYRSGDPETWKATSSEMLAHYPRSYGPVEACKRCQRARN